MVRPGEDDTPVRAVLRAAIYTRVSKDPHGRARSVTEQEAECRAECARQGWTVVTVLQDNDRGASQWARRDRPAYRQLAGLLRDGGADVLVTWEASRAQRDLAAYVQLRDLCAQRGVLWSYSGRVYDLSRTDDRRNTGLDALFAEEEAGRTRDRILRTVRRQAEAGAPHGRIPYGYRREYDPTTGNLLRQEPHPDEAPIVREIAHRLLTGEALYSIAADLNARDVPAPRRLREWTPNQVKRIAINPTYAGLRAHKDAEPVPATWPGLVSVVDHRVLRAKLTDPARKTWRDGSIKHLLVGIVVCGVCDAPCRRVKNRNTPSYMCPNKFCVVVAQQPLDELVTALVIERMSRKDALALFADEEDAVAAAAAEKARDLRARLKKFKEAAAAGRIELEDYTEIAAQIREDIKAAERLALPRGLPAVVTEMAGPDAAEYWEKLLIPQRRTVVRALMRPRVMPVGKGKRIFDPERIIPGWLDAKGRPLTTQDHQEGEDR